MKIAYLKEVSTERKVERRGTIRFDYLITDAEGENLSITYSSRVHARRAAAAMNLALMENINEAELKALWRWKRQHGKFWRTELGAFWEKERAHSDGATLQQLRNRLGPTWLATFKLPMEPDHADHT